MLVSVHKVNVLNFQMMAADMYQVFAETGFEDLTKLSQVGQRYVMRSIFWSDDVLLVNLWSSLCDPLRQQLSRKRGGLSLVIQGVSSLIQGVM